MSNELEHKENSSASQDTANEPKEKKTAEKGTKPHNIFLIDKAKLNLSNSTILSKSIIILS